VTNFSDDVNTLYQNQADGTFVDATAAAGLGGVVRPYLGWSTALFDADNDGWLDLFVANGHLYPQLEKHPSGLRYPQRNLFYWNEGGIFRRADAGPGLEVEKVSRGTAFGDYDNDGDVDLLVMNLNDTPTLLQNQGGNRNNWLGLELVGEESNRDALGARVLVFGGGRKQVREVKRGYGYQSQHDGRVLFGLGQKEEVERVEIHWPAGKIQVLERPSLRRYLKLREGVREPVASYGAVEEKDSGGVPLAETRAQEPEPENYLPTAGESDWSAEDYYEKGVELHEQARYEEALPMLRAAIQQRPDYTEAYYSLGVTLYSGLGRSQEAAGLLEQVVARDSSWADIFTLLGGIYMSLNQSERAIPMLERAVVLDPGAWKSRNWLGVAHLRRGDTKRAVAAFQGAVQAAPYAPVPHSHLSRIYGRLGRDEAARREQAWFERLRPIQGQIDSYKGQLKETPADVELHYLLGREYLKQGRHAETLSAFARAVELDPGYGLVHYSLGAMHHRQGNLEQAITAYERAYEADSSLVMALNDLGVAYRQVGRLQEAIEVYQKVTRLRPGFARIHSNLGRAYAEQGKNQEAIRAYRKALELDSTLVQTRRALEQLYATARIQKGLPGK
jgi:tetratricopeptide (TPR) repeat protein